MFALYETLLNKPEMLKFEQSIVYYTFKFFSKTRMRVQFKNHLLNKFIYVHNYIYISYYNYTKNVPFFKH